MLPLSIVTACLDLAWTCMCCSWLTDCLPSTLAAPSKGPMPDAAAHLDKDQLVDRQRHTVKVKVACGVQPLVAGPVALLPPVHSLIPAIWTRVKRGLPSGKRCYPQTWACVCECGASQSVSMPDEP